jgi:hypothetical protein
VRASYVLPLRWSDDGELAELTAYLRELSARVEVLVVDGSPELVFARHAAAWAGLVTHVRPDPSLGFLNGKVDGVTTGVRLAAHEHVVIADDDVRYDEAALCRVVELLDRYDLVRPQNFFDPLPWHARWDSGRTLLNRAVAADYPGTFGVRRSTFVGMGGYDGDVLFENLELIRSVRAYGGMEVRPLDLYVRRIPPTSRHFLGQRVRQAYDDLAQPWRLALWLGVWPAAAVGVRRRGVPALGAGAAAVVATAEVGRRRAGGRAVYPPSLPVWAPLWVAERATCSWVALARRVLAAASSTPVGGSPDRPTRCGRSALGRRPAGTGRHLSRPSAPAAPAPRRAEAVPAPARPDHATDPVKQNLWTISRDTV